jgi:hypothetical protein
VIYFQKTKMGKKNRITIELETKSVRENARLLVPPASRCRQSTSEQDSQPELGEEPRRSLSGRGGHA